MLVPPSQDVGSPTQGVAAAPVDANAAPVKKKKTIFDLFKGTSDEPVPQAQQVASAEPQAVPDASAQPAPAPQTTQATTPAAPAPSGTGYFVQLASFRTQPEAQSEYDRLRSQHAGIIGGVRSNISQATVAGSTRYRVGLGPVASREEAAKLCNSLFAAGERDCIVRTQ